ncbi:MAG: MoaD/ThiS family protein [Nanoarchaeota archaeon]
MEITVIRERERTRQNLRFNGKTIRELLTKLKINPEVVLVVRKNEVLTEEEVLHDKDEITLMSVVSGG